jgi:hypothetical protein
MIYCQVWNFHLDCHIGDMRGDDFKIPLGAMIIRKEERPWITTVTTLGDYITIIDLMTDHSPHWELHLLTGWEVRPYHYAPQDNHKLLKILLTSFQNTPAYTYMERFER